MNYLLLTPLFFIVTSINTPLFITSPAFANEGTIPVKYSCEGQNINPPINIEQLPVSTKSITIIVDDPDAPNGVFDHWVVYNLMPGKMIPENSIPGTEGINGAGKSGYTGPCPPTGMHHYHFKVYALDKVLDLQPGADKATVEKAMDGHLLAFGELVGTYQKTK